MDSTEAEDIEHDISNSDSDTILDKNLVILDSDTILKIINDIQTEKIPSMEIRKKYKLSIL